MWEQIKYNYKPKKVIHNNIFAYWAEKLEIRVLFRTELRFEVGEKLPLMSKGANMKEVVAANALHVITSQENKKKVLSSGEGRC